MFITSFNTKIQSNPNTVHTHIKKIIQYVDALDKSPLLSKAAKQEIQAIVGSLLYYAKAIDSTLLPALNTLLYQQSKPTETTKKLAIHLLDYVATYPDAVI